MKKTFGIAATILFSLILPLVVPTAHAQSPAPTHPPATHPHPQVFDANGRRVGQWAGTTDGFRAVIMFQVAGKAFVVNVSSGGFDGNASSNAVWFESNDCSGTPLLQEQGGLVPVTAVQIPGATVYVALLGAVPQVVIIRSNIEASFPGGCNTGGYEPFPLPVVEAEALIDLSAFFTPPFRAGLR